MRQGDEDPADQGDEGRLRKPELSSPELWTADSWSVESQDTEGLQPGGVVPGAQGVLELHHQTVGRVHGGLHAGGEAPILRV